MIYKCKGCGSALRYDMLTGKLLCDTCGSTYEPADYDGILDNESHSYETMEQKIYTCNACGAKLMINDVEAASFCAYCGQPTIVFDRVSKIRKPDLILPFKITKEQARDLINKKLNGFFIPKDIKDIELDVVRGIYVPFSFSDLEYEDKQIIKGEVKNGKSSVTRFFYRHAKAKFSFLPVDQSVKFDDESAVRLEPFPKNEFVPFDASYLSGFYADAGDEAKEDLDMKIKYRAGEVFNKKVEDTVKAGKKVLYRNNREVNIEQTRYGMLPVWFFACRREEATYTIMVNGYTGKVVGAVPFDKVKVAVCATLIGLPLCLLCGTVCGFLFSGVTDLDDDMDALKLVVAGIVAVFAAATAKLNKFKRSRKLTMESAIFELAKDRQEV